MKLVFQVFRLCSENLFVKFKMIVTFLALSCQLSFKFKFTGQLIEPLACVDKFKQESLLLVNILPI